MGERDGMLPPPPAGPPLPELIAAAKTPSGRPAAIARTAGGFLGGGGALAALLWWGVQSVQAESEAVRERLDRVVEAQQETATATKLLAQKLEAFMRAADKEHERAEQQRDRLEGRLDDQGRRRGGKR